MRHGNSIGHFFYAVTLSCIYVLGLIGCASGDDGSLTIINSSLPDGTVNQPYSAAVSGSGGLPPYTWSVTPALPANLSFNTQTGAITGTPVTVGTTSHTFTLLDSLSPPQAVQKSLTLTIKPPLSLTTTSLPDGTVNQAYSQPLEATGGIGQLIWSIVGGTLPPGLGLDATTGVISGTPTPTALGTSSFTVQVADSGEPKQVATRGLSIRINPPSPPTITTTSLPCGKVGLPYSQTLQATGGAPPLAWNVIGSLPVNLTLSSGGTISGTPTAAGLSNFSVRVTDALGQAATQALSLTIVVSGALTITTPSLPSAKVGNPYNTTLQQSGGACPPFTWSVIPPPALPTGLNLNASNGQITGTPAAGTAGASSLTFTVRDSFTPPQTANKVLSLTINP